MPFEIDYVNGGVRVPLPDVHEGYDLESAYHDYDPAALSATVTVDGYALPLQSTGFVELVRAVLPLAEDLRAGPRAGSEDEYRKQLPEVPRHARIHTWTFPYYMTQLPVLVFAADGPGVSIYTRTLETSREPRLVVQPGRDREAPVEVAREDVIAELRGFLSRYLDDVASAFPFIVDDPMYQDHVRRLAALAP